MAEEKVPFIFEVLIKTLPGEVVGLTGDSEELGNWSYQNSIFLQPKSMESAGTNLPEG